MLALTYFSALRFSYILNRDALGQGRGEGDLPHGLVGAIQRLTVNGDPAEGAELSDAALDSAGVTRYRGPPCHAHRCANGGVCRPRLRAYVCVCPPGYHGHRCETSK